MKIKLIASLLALCLVFFLGSVQALNSDRDLADGGGAGLVGSQYRLLHLLNHTGDMTENVTGNITGTFICNMTGNTTGNMTGTFICNMTGNRTGVAGNTNNMTIIGVIIGNVTGKMDNTTLNGTIEGIITGSMENKTEVIKQETDRNIEESFKHFS